MNRLRDSIERHGGESWKQQEADAEKERFLVEYMGIWRVVGLGALSALPEMEGTCLSLSPLMTRLKNLAVHDA